MKVEKRTLEIGPGANPYPLQSGWGKEGQEYFGVDPVYGSERGRYVVEVLRERLNSPQVCRGLANLLPLDATNTSFPAGYFDKAVAVNVFGQPDLKPLIPAFLAEIARVLKIGGELVVAETVTPWRLSFWELESLAKRAGFVSTGSNNSPHMRNNRFRLEQYDKNVTGAESYMAVFTNGG